MPAAAGKKLVRSSPVLALVAALPAAISTANAQGACSALSVAADAIQKTQEVMQNYPPLEWTRQLHNFNAGYVAGKRSPFVCWPLMAAIETATRDPEGTMRLAGSVKHLFSHVPRPAGLAMTPQGALGLPNVNAIGEACCP